MGGSEPISQPESPIHLSSCYLGTNFMFGDPKLKSEQTKMQLSADLLEAVPEQYRLLGLRFEFGRKAGKRTSDVVVFTPSTLMRGGNIMDTAPPGLRPSGYLSRVPDYNDVGCAVDFATSLDWKRSWFDGGSDVVACPAPMPVPESVPVWLTALELRQTSSDAVFLMPKGKSVSWSLDGSTPKVMDSDASGRAVVSLRQPSQSAHTLTFGADAAALDQQICFRPFYSARYCNNRAPARPAARTRWPQGASGV